MDDTRPELEPMPKLRDERMNKIIAAAQSGAARQLERLRFLVAQLSQDEGKEKTPETVNHSSTKQGR